MKKKIIKNSKVPYFSLLNLIFCLRRKQALTTAPQINEVMHTSVVSLPTNIQRKKQTVIEIEKNKRAAVSKITS